MRIEQDGDINPPVFAAEGIGGEFRAYADHVNAALEETVETGLFEHVDEAEFIVVHQFKDAHTMEAELKTWTGHYDSRNFASAHDSWSPSLRGSRARKAPVGSDLGALFQKRSGACETALRSGLGFTSCSANQTPAGKRAAADPR
jgi:hypothetical protein